MKNILKKELQSDLMLYDTEEDAVHVLNKTARRIYELFMEGVPETEIESRIRREFNQQENDTIPAEIRSCLDELKEKGLLEVAASYG